MKKLTEEEVCFLSEEYNLADGHAFRKWNDREYEIIDNVAKTFHKADRRNQQTIETNYLCKFFNLSRQSYRPDYFKFFLSFTASTGLEVIGNYLRMCKYSVALIEPCFDNLHDILSRHGIRMFPFNEKILGESHDLFVDYLDTLTPDVVFLVSPNNPTGAQVSEVQFISLIEYCLRNDKILILDTCFRFYLPTEKVYDEYKLLADSNVKCILIEDTGKTWPTLELKAPFFSVSPQLAGEIGRIYSDFLLHVSPVSVVLMTNFLELPEQQGLGYIHKLIETNRSVLNKEIEGTFLVSTEASYMSVAWLKISIRLLSSQLKEFLSESGVFVLSGNQFFWSDPEKGESFIRIALNRDPEMFKEAAIRLGRLIRNPNIYQYGKGT